MFQASSSAWNSWLSKQWQHTSYSSLSIMHQYHKIQEHTRWNSALQNSVLFWSILILFSSLWTFKSFSKCFPTTSSQLSWWGKKRHVKGNVDINGHEEDVLVGHNISGTSSKTQTGPHIEEYYFMGPYLLTSFKSVYRCRAPLIL